MSIDVRPEGLIPRRWTAVWVCVVIHGLWALPATGDGKVVPPRDYSGSIEEQAQEAIVIFHSSDTQGQAVEDLILKIRVQGDANANARKFAWVVPLPAEPTIAKEDPKLFQELFTYVQSRTVRYPSKKWGSKGAAQEAKPAARPAVEVLARRVVGSYDTAVVRENVAGALNKWLEAEGFQTLPNAEDVIGFYRKKGYVFACVKVSDAELSKDKPVDSHPLRFTFKTGGRDGIYYPMRMTGLQSRPFDVNLYIFYSAWINDRLNKFGYVHRGFRLRHRDWDTSKCKANAGKTYSAPKHDPYLAGLAHTIPTVAKLFQKLHPGQRYYLTNIQATGLKPDAVRQWSDDLWVFPYYVDRGFVPYDARAGGAASAAWPGESAAAPDDEPGAAGLSRAQLFVAVPAAALGVAAISALTIGITVRRRRNTMTQK